MVEQKQTTNVPVFARGWALFLDVDGTLLDIAPEPDQVVVSQELKVLLEQLNRQTGEAIALISGRPIADLDQLFKPHKFIVSGQHGLERRDHNGAEYILPVPDGNFSLVKKEIIEFANARQNLIIEDKVSSIAIHYRKAQEYKTVLEGFLQDCMKKIEMDFHMQSGKMVYEIKPKGKDKGTAIQDFMQEYPFAEKLPVFIGDDLTDEDGFLVVNDLGGHSIKVGDGDTSARWRLNHSVDVLSWLESYLYFLKN